MVFTNTSRYQLIVLSAKINDNNLLSVHRFSSWFS